MSVVYEEILIRVQELSVEEKFKLIDNLLKSVQHQISKDPKPEKKPRFGGSWEGKVWMAEDFDETPEDIIKSFYGESE